MLSHGVIFNLGSTNLCSPAIIETYLSYDRQYGFAVTDYSKNSMYLYSIVLFLLVAILQLINFTASKFTYIVTYLLY